MTENNSKLLIDEPPLQVLPSLARLLDVNKAIILQQIQYWSKTSGHEIEGASWIYNSYKEWSRQFPWLTARAVRWHIKGLEEMGLIVAGNFNQDARDNTKWYKIDYVKLEELLNASGGVAKSDIPSVNKRQVQVAKNGRPLPETTSETTIEPQLEVLVADDNEREIIGVLRKAGVLESSGVCVELLRRAKAEFPFVDLLAESKAWAARKLSEPLTKRSRPLGQLWNWFRKADEFRKERRGKDRRDTEAAGAERLVASVGKPLR